MKTIRYIGIIGLMTILCLTLGSAKRQEQQEIAIQAFMCRTSDCEKIYIDIIKTANKSIYCAFFDFDLPDLNNAIKIKNLSKLIYIDKDNSYFNETYIIYDNRSAYMHNKFCIIDSEILITGSFNPTINGKEKNDNNIVIIRSQQISEIYTDYFFHSIKNNNSIDKSHDLYFSDANISICFSRGGDCLDKIQNELKKATKTIYFMLFTMTDLPITNLILLKSYNNITIEGFFERSLITKYSSFHKLDYHNISVDKDCNPAKLHHKVFIVDNKTVITGSMNPSNNADKNNEENLIIIHNQNIAEKFLNEYHRIKAKCMT